MDLKEFVKESLIQIVKGVKESQEEIINLGGFANPAIEPGHIKMDDNTCIASFSNGQHIYMVDFNVAVTVTDSITGNTGGKLQVASIFSVKAGGSKDKTNEATSRISFQVPLALPIDPFSLEQNKQEQRRQQREYEDAMSQ